MYFNADLLQEIKARIDLRAVVEAELGPGKATGQSMRWCCPFHQGTNPTAFSVTSTRFYCWSCEEEGDILAWYMKRDNLDFKQAVVLAAQEAGISLPNLSAPPVTRPPRARSVRQLYRPWIHPNKTGSGPSTIM